MSDPERQDRERRERDDEGDDELDRGLSPSLYDEVRRIADELLRRDRARWMISSSDVAHEVLLRAVRSGVLAGLSRGEQLRRVAKAVRRLLVDLARRRAAVRHGGKVQIVALETDPSLELGSAPLDVLAIDEALEDLARLDERQAQMVELRYFGGHTVAEVADVLGVSVSTVEKEERRARSYLMTILT